jgi:hypothetical protein
MPSESELITKGSYHISIAKKYLEGFKLECRQSAKYQAGQWVQKLEWLEKEIYSALTPQGKELFKKELLKGDVLFFPAISNNIMQMNDEQRELMERLSESILKGETI